MGGKNQLPDRRLVLLCGCYFRLLKSVGYFAFRKAVAECVSFTIAVAIVMLVRWMSHSMFYKIKATGSLTDTKIIMCNTKNKDTIYQKMFNEII